LQDIINTGSIDPYMNNNLKLKLLAFKSPSLILIKNSSEFYVFNGDPRKIEEIREFIIEGYELEEAHEIPLEETWYTMIIYILEGLV
jgi:hypothetical protein